MGCSRATAKQAHVHLFIVASQACIHVLAVPLLPATHVRVQVRPSVAVHRSCARSAAAPLVCGRCFAAPRAHARICPRVRLPPHLRSRPSQQVQKGQCLQGTQVSRPILMALPRLPAGLHRVASRVPGWRLVARHSEAAPSPGRFSRAKVSNVDGSGGKGENATLVGVDRVAHRSLPSLGE